MYRDNVIYYVDYKNLISLLYNNMINCEKLRRIIINIKSKFLNNNFTVRTFNYLK